MNDERKVQYTFYLEQEQLDALRSRSGYGASVAELMRRAIAEYLEKLEKETDE